MTAAQLLVVGLCLFALGVISTLLWLTYELRQDRIDREHWNRVPGAVPPSEELFDWAADAARDDWSRRA